MMMEAPGTITGWFQLAALMTTVLAAWTGFAASIAKGYIKTAVGDTVRTEMEKSMEPVQLQLTTMNGEMARVRKIETKLENGLEKRQKRIEEQVDTIVTHLMWDGNSERRRTGDQHVITEDGV